MATSGVARRTPHHNAATDRWPLPMAPRGLATYGWKMERRQAAVRSGWERPGRTTHMAPHTHMSQASVSSHTDTEEEAVHILSDGKQERESARRGRNWSTALAGVEVRWVGLSAKWPQLGATRQLESSSSERVLDRQRENPVFHNHSYHLRVVDGAFVLMKTHMWKVKETMIQSLEESDTQLVDVSDSL
ncbi:hypothetical protein EYF80_043664 [Liparis tanakae]|uniref:Uncharacterized protein n=1 Tax=Liparis tanakae TaxID=230148 RepID=A0A4Z2FXT4_9TELE|nr:hypothetical protein EYF80_043664 [Liparis tanakae]